MKIQKYIQANSNHFTPRCACAVWGKKSRAIHIQGPCTEALRTWDMSPGNSGAVPFTSPFQRALPPGPPHPPPPPLQFTVLSCLPQSPTPSTTTITVHCVELSPPSPPHPPPPPSQFTVLSCLPPSPPHPPPPPSQFTVLSCLPPGGPHPPPPPSQFTVLSCLN